MATFGQLLRAKLAAAGMKKATLQQLLADKGVHVHTHTIRRWTNNEFRPLGKKLVVLVDVLDVPKEERIRWYAAAATGGEI